jgi:D-alanyl-D-alanine carboxypeptidase/D-alanyl-D-alanine-endopeptidase (penicillin-binding protein 4)
VSAELEVRMLRHAWQHADLFRQLNIVLPVAGVDGTLKTRMKKTAAERNVHAKTGSLSGISSLAGFCTAPNGHVLCFAIINQGVSRMSDGRQFQDQVCEAMCKY